MRIVVVVAAIVGSTGAWLAQRDAGPRSPRAVQDDSALARIRRDYAVAYDAGDATRMATFYDDDAVRLPYDAPAVQGRAAIEAAYQRYFASRRFRARLELIADDVIIEGNHAIERGRYHERQETETSVRREDGKYVVVAVRSGQTWQYHWSIFNRDSAAVRLVAPSPNSVRVESR